MTLRRLFSLVLIAGVMVGCINQSSTFTVRPDGSGTVNERVVLNPQLTKMMKMQQRQDTTTASEELFTKEKIQSVVDTLEGLRFESMERISGPRGEGYEVTYAFDNLNEVRKTPQLEDVMPDQSGKQGKMEVGGFNVGTDLEMSMESGSPATLTITVPRDTSDGMAFNKPGDGPPSDQQMRMMRKMLSDSGLRVAVEVDGEIVETDATYRSGSTVKIIDMDFGELAKDSTAFRGAFGEPPESPQAFIENLNGKPGMAIEPKETVTIRFK